MVHILYYNYTNQPLTCDGKRVGQVTVYGPFECRLSAIKWAEDNLLSDKDHEWKMSPLKIIGIL